MISFRRPSLRLPLAPAASGPALTAPTTTPTAKAATKATAKTANHVLQLLPELPLTISSGPERRKHLALVGDAEWVRYWQLDMLAYASEQNLRSFVISGPKDDALRAMPSALALPESQVNIREELPYSIDPADFRSRVDIFTQLSGNQEPALMFAGRDLKHVWPFILGRKRDLQAQFTFGIADMTPNLKLPVSETFRYFLVQDTHQEQFQAAVERWHRHESVKPNYIETEISGKNCLFYEVKDSN